MRPAYPPRLPRQIGLPLYVTAVLLALAVSVGLWLFNVWLAVKAARLLGWIP